MNPTRSLQACRRCRQKKIKCSGTRPSCRNCMKHGNDCVWPSGILQGRYQIVNLPEPAEEVVDSPPPVASPEPLPALTQPLCTRSKIPPEDLIHRSLEIFWRRHHPVELCSFLHRPTFDPRHSDDQNLFLIYSIISLASIYFSESEARTHGFESPMYLSQYFAARASKLSQNLSLNPTVVSVQANLILGLREVIAWTGCNAWMNIGLAIRMAQALRLSKEYNQRHSAIERESRRRTFWACIFMDRLVGFSNARPQTVPIATLAIHLPSTEASFAYGEDSPGPMLVDLLDFRGKVSEVGVLPFLLAAVVVWGKAANYFIGGKERDPLGPNNTSSDFCQISKEVRDWLHGLPSYMQWTMQNYQLHKFQGQAEAFLTMHILLRHALCVGHHEYLPYHHAIGHLETTMPFQTAVASDRLISTALNNVADIVHIVKSVAGQSPEDRESLKSILIGCTFSTAVSVCLWADFTRATHPSHLSRRDFETLRELILPWRTQWPAAHALVETIEVIFSIYYNSFNMSRGLLTDTGQPLLETEDIRSDVTDTTASNACSPHDDQSSTNYKPSVGDGLPDRSAFSSGFYGAVRDALLGPLESIEFKKLSVSKFLRSAFQNLQLQNLLQVAEMPDLPTTFGNATSDLLGDGLNWDELGFSFRHTDVENAANDIITRS